VRLANAILAVVCFAAVGCGGNVLYAGRLPSAALEPIAQEWRDEGALLDIVYGPVTSGDRIELVPPGGLARFATPDDVVCAHTEPGDILDGTPTIIYFDPACLDETSMPDRNAVLHEFGHYIGLHHLPNGECGIMQAGSIAGHQQSLMCADKRAWAEHEGRTARPCTDLVETNEGGS
jgi:hypothetical protein